MMDAGYQTPRCLPDLQRIVPRLKEPATTFIFYLQYDASDRLELYPGSSAVTCHWLPYQFGTCIPSARCPVLDSTVGRATRIINPPSSTVVDRCRFSYHNYLFILQSRVYFWQILATLWRVRCSCSIATFTSRSVLLHYTVFAGIK